MMKYIFLFFLLIFSSINCYAQDMNIDSDCVIKAMQKEFTKTEMTEMQYEIKTNNVLSIKYKKRFEIIIENCLK
jgi:hypothetical protein